MNFLPYDFKQIWSNSKITRIITNFEQSSPGFHLNYPETICDRVFKSGLSKFFKGCLPKNLPSPLLNTLSHLMLIRIHFSQINVVLREPYVNIPRSWFLERFNLVGEFLRFWIYCLRLSLVSPLCTEKLLKENAQFLLNILLP